MNPAVVATEASAPAAFAGAKMLFDPDRSRRRLVISAGDGVAGGAIAIHLTDMRFVRELRAVGSADVFCREWLDASVWRGVANDAS